METHNSKPNTFIQAATEMSEGDGVDVNRLFPVTRDRMNFDPFVLWDNFNIGPDRGFPTHPHRGFEAITYMFTGSIEHKDNLGNHSTVISGGAQRFTAGRGIEHSEMPDSQGMSNGIQLWINLSKDLKQIEPSYQQVDKGNIPLKKIEGGSVSVIVGDDSPVKLKTPVRYLEVNLEKEASLTENVPGNFRGFVYLIKGQLKINEDVLSKREAYFFENIKTLNMQALSESQYMICMGQPHCEPIHQHGPFVD